MQNPASSGGCLPSSAAPVISSALEGVPAQAVASWLQAPWEPRTEPQQLTLQTTQWARALVLEPGPLSSRWLSFLSLAGGPQDSAAAGMKVDTAGASLAFSPHPPPHIRPRPPIRHPASRGIRQPGSTGMGSQVPLQPAAEAGLKNGRGTTRPPLCPLLGIPATLAPRPLTSPRQLVRKDKSTQPQQSLRSSPRLRVTILLKNHLEFPSRLSDNKPN